MVICAFRPTQLDIGHVGLAFNSCRFTLAHGMWLDTDSIGPCEAVCFNWKWKNSCTALPFTALSSFASHFPSRTLCYAICESHIRICQGHLP